VSLIVKAQLLALLKFRNHQASALLNEVHVTDQPMTTHRFTQIRDIISLTEIGSYPVHLAEARHQTSPSTQDNFRPLDFQRRNAKSATSRASVSERRHQEGVWWGGVWGNCSLFSGRLTTCIICSDNVCGPAIHRIDRGQNETERAPNNRKK
jgi:hypothetical protein